MKPVPLKKKIVTSKKNSIINIFEKAAREAGKELIHDFGKIENDNFDTKLWSDFFNKISNILDEILFTALINLSSFEYGDVDECIKCLIVEIMSLVPSGIPL